MNKKRLIITSTISIILVCILLIGSTYSIFTSSDVDEKLNVYQTGNLDVTYTLSEDNVTLSHSTPTSIEDSVKIKPYRITVINNGTVPYQFNVLLENTTASNAIDSQYIMTQVGKIEPKNLGACTDNIIKEEVIVPAGKSVDIDVRVWVSDTVKNTEINKSFFAKLTIDGVAVYDKNEEIDNSVLIAEYRIPLSEVEPGSYVAYTGNNGCTGASCTGQNANYVDDTNMGYCFNSVGNFKVNGWRVAYSKDDTAYLVSAGSPECMCTSSDGTTSSTSCSNNETTGGVPQHLANLNSMALKYCNSTYAYGGICNNTNSWNMNAIDFQNITKSSLSDSFCYEQSESTACGYENDLIDNGGAYWLATSYRSTSPYAFFWEPSARYMGSNLARFHLGVRPILRLDPSVWVIGGSGTYQNPYQISKGPVKPEPGSAAEYIVNKYKDGSTLTTVNIGGDTSKPTVSQNAMQGIMLDNNGEYRYYGANPNNYVTFNNELWRIISVSNVKSSASDTKGSMRLKIIRTAGFGGYSWDSSESTVNSGNGVNDWSKSDLKTELNTLYYNKQSGTCYNGQNNASITCDFTSTGLSTDARNMMGDALWYLGGVDSLFGSDVDDYYNFERGTTTYGCSTDDGACPRATSWVGKVGLIYPSDYGYATDQSLCEGSPSNWMLTGNEACRENDWLLNWERGNLIFNSNSYWTISPKTNNASSVFYIYSPEASVSDSTAKSSFDVLPVVFLKPNVSIVGGEGTESNPYQLSIS